MLVLPSPDDIIVDVSWFQVHINLGAGESEMSSPLNVKLNDLQWHTVKLIRNEAEIQLIIDNEHTSRYAGIIMMECIKRNRGRTIS